MIQQAIVVSVDEKNSEAKVLPLITGACISCKEACSRRGAAFTVRNTKKFPIKNGSVVSIAASASAEAVQSVLSLLVPALFAVAAFVFSTPLSLYVWQRPASEGFKALCVLAGILVPSAAVLALSRFKIRPSKPHIEKVFF